MDDEIEGNGSIAAIINIVGEGDPTIEALQEHWPKKVEDQRRVLFLLMAQALKRLTAVEVCMQQRKQGVRRLEILLVFVFALSVFGAAHAASFDVAGSFIGAAASGVIGLIFTYAKGE